MAVPGLILFLDLINTNPQQPTPAANTQRTHWSPKWALLRGLVGRRTHASARIFSQLSRLWWRLRKTPSLCCLWVDQIRLIQFWHVKVIRWTKALAKREQSSNWEGTLPRPNSQTAVKVMTWSVFRTFLFSPFSFRLQLNILINNLFFCVCVWIEIRKSKQGLGEALQRCTETNEYGSQKWHINVRWRWRYSRDHAQ